MGGVIKGSMCLRDDLRWGVKYVRIRGMGRRILGTTLHSEDSTPSRCTLGGVKDRNTTLNF